MYENAVLAHVNPHSKKMNVELAEAKDAARTSINKVASKHNAILTSIEQDIEDIQTYIEAEKREADKLREAITAFKSATQPTLTK